MMTQTSTHNVSTQAPTAQASVAPTAGANPAQDVPVLPSYVLGGWWTPAQVPDNAPTARDASTGAPIARVSTDGLDMGAVVHYAREVGHPGLAALTIHERAALLKSLAQFLREKRPDLYALSAATGATRGDSMVDIDGGIGVLFTMSSKARRELPNAHVVVDGPIERLSADGSFLGRHIYTSAPGVEVEINAFNFPVWGMLEKFAPAFIAGVPSIVKPATGTGYLTEAVVREMIGSGLLPEGSLQLISGSTGDLLEHLDYRDMVAFTGSAATAETLRAALEKNASHTQNGGTRDHANGAARGTHDSANNRGAASVPRFSSETDSLNAAILGPDAGVDTPEFQAFIRAVQTEMTVKAGQKCTAIRRVIVPEALKADVIAALAERLDTKVTLGDPRALNADTGKPAANMGALASARQAQDVRAAVGTLRDAGGTLAYGSLEQPAVVLGDGSRGVAGDGAFMSPVVLDFADPWTQAVHEVEAFGPVTSVLGYANVAEAVELAARGSGSLVATVCTNDPVAMRELVTGIAAHHGRVHILNRDSAATSTGHGSPVPHLIHGGPGRAGGGEELGGTRAILHHMQRSAVQGSPDMLTELTGVWHTGARQQLAGDPDFGGSAEVQHPFRKSLAQLRIGDGVASGLRTVTEQDIADFAASTGDHFYAHTDQEAAAANPFFPGIVAHGYLLVSWAAGLFVDGAPGPVLANSGLENLRFLTPVAAGDQIRVVLCAEAITPREDQDYGEVRWDATLYNQNDDVVATYDVLTLVAKE